MVTAENFLNFSLVQCSDENIAPVIYINRLSRKMRAGGGVAKLQTAELCRIDSHDIWLLFGFSPQFS